uniref:Uncharacterized protein n=1 Tax=Rhizophora mucronata TaxID=61149 RepID=A0A2P2QYK2_RHIMU
MHCHTYHLHFSLKLQFSSRSTLFFQTFYSHQ